MISSYLSKLTEEQRTDLIEKLFEGQKGRCFICEEPVDLDVHSVQIDHVIPVTMRGNDDPSNFALSHPTCNASKQDANLRVARVLHRFSKIRDACMRQDTAPNLSDILSRYGGSKHDLSLAYEEDARTVKYSLAQIGDISVRRQPVYTDELSGFKYFFVEVPIEYLFHDERLNPRSIGQNISKLLKEFFLKRPQLHISLGWVELAGQGPARIRIFDGQHKLAAQVLLGVRRLPVRVFLDPDPDILLTTNTNAGTTLMQVAFDKSVQRHLGSALYIDRVERYQRERELASDDFAFSERDLVDFYKGESRAMKRYILDSVRDTITHHKENKLKEFVDFGGRGKEKPLSYSTVEKTFYSLFIHQEVLDQHINYRLDEGENPRQIEREQIVNLMNIIAEEILIGRFDLDIGSVKIENRIQKGDDIPENHLAAFRMCKEEILHNWLRYIRQIILNYFIVQGTAVQEQRLFQRRFPTPLWMSIKNFLRNLRSLPLWVNRDLSGTVFGGKQNYEYWGTVFEQGRTPQGLRILPEPLHLMNMIRDSSGS